MTQTQSDDLVTRLLPCPFCGGQAKRHTIGADEPNNAGGDVIVCTSCNACSHVEFGRKENLVSRWNTRVVPTEAAAEIQRLQAQVAVARDLLASLHYESLGIVSREGSPFDTAREKVNAYFALASIEGAAG